MMWDFVGLQWVTAKWGSGSAAMYHVISQYLKMVIFEIAIPGLNSQSGVKQFVIPGSNFRD